MALPILDGNQTATTLSTVLTSGEHIPAHTVVSLGSVAISNITSAVSGSVVSVSNFPSTQTIAGTVTANVPLIRDEVLNNSSVVYPVSGVDVNAIRAVLYSGPDFSSDTGAPVDGTNPLYVQGTVGVQGTVTASLADVTDPINDNGTSGKTVAVKLYDANGSPYQNSNRFFVSGSVTLGSGLSQIGSVTVGAMPSGALTTRFGSVATANLAFITSAVTNTSRKYLLAQNISAGTVTIGIGFSPTTTQGIQLSAGGGLTFDAFCPTGAVYWLGAVTGAAFTILEG